MSEVIQSWSKNGCWADHRFCMAFNGLLEVQNEVKLGQSWDGLPVVDAQGQKAQLWKRRRYRVHGQTRDGQISRNLMRLICNALINSPCARIGSLTTLASGGKLTLSQQRHQQLYDDCDHPQLCASKAHRRWLPPFPWLSGCQYSKSNTWGWVWVWLSCEFLFKTFSLGARLFGKIVKLQNG